MHCARSQMGGIKMALLQWVCSPHQQRAPMGITAVVCIKYTAQWKRHPDLPGPSVTMRSVPTRCEGAWAGQECISGREDSIYRVTRGHLPFAMLKPHFSCLLNLNFPNCKPKKETALHTKMAPPLQGGPLTVFPF